jgi:translation initiation factor IF-1
MVARPEPPRERGVITVAHPNALFTVHLDAGRELRLPLAGKLRTYPTRLAVGDRALVELSPFDQQRGRIVARDRTDEDEPNATARVIR